MLGAMNAAVRRLVTQRPTMLVLAFAFSVFSLLDCLTTSYGISHGAEELNPFQAAVLGHSLDSFLMLRTAVVTTVIAGLDYVPRRLAPWLGLGSTALTAVVVVSNLHAIVG